LKRKSRQTEAAEHEKLVQELAQLNEKLAQIEKHQSPLLFVTDVTPEKLAEMLAENGETLAHVDSDAADALGIIMGTRYGDGKHTQESLWLKSYTGEATVIFRKNGKPIHLVAPCLSVLFVATPDKVQELFRIPRLTSGGLLPRFLVCDPAARPVALSATADSKHILPTDLSQQYEAAIFAALSRYRFSAAEDPDEIEMTAAAYRLLIAAWNGFCASSNGTRDQPFEARHTENAIRIALVLHAFTHVEILQESPGRHHAVHRGHECPLDDQTFRNALQIRNWFTLHQENLRKPQRAAADENDWHKAQTLMRSRDRNVGITPRDLINLGIAKSRQEADEYLARWKTEGRIEAFPRTHEGAGRPTIAYRLAALGRR
jgi:hypothetical protein